MFGIDVIFDKITNFVLEHQQLVIHFGECGQRIISRTVYTTSLLLDPVVSLLSLFHIITIY